MADLPGTGADCGIALHYGTNLLASVKRTMRLYRAIDVWQQIEGSTVVRYRCFQSLDNGKYCVQSSDYYHDGKITDWLDNYFIEWFTEQDPAERAGEHDTLDGAIAAHIKYHGI
jgi:hypothetical protein